MNLPFTTDQFLDVFGLYNTSVWPAQIFLLLIALVSLLFSVFKTRSSSLIISVSLSILWLWDGIVYHFIFFRPINKLANLFAALFILQAVLFLYFGVITKQLNFEYKNRIVNVAAIVLFLYALIFYPLLGIAFGHIYPRIPTFGLPCPTTIFTFGLILLVDKRINAILFIIPFIWSLIGFSAALKLGILQDIGLLASALIAFGHLFYEKSRKNQINKV